MLVASGANANVFDPAGSELHIYIGGLVNSPVYGDAGAGSQGALFGAIGSETITTKGMGMGQPNIFETGARGAGENFFTGTPSINNLFLTVQNGDGTFTHQAGGSVGSFQGAEMCGGTGCFGGSSGLIGQVIIELLATGGTQAPVPIGVVGVGGTTTVTVGAAQVIVEGAEWITGSAPITGIASNVISITTGPRAGTATGIGFTLQPTVNEDSLVITENGATQVTVTGSADFTTASDASPGVNQVTLISPAYIDASGLTGNPPLPGMGIKVLRFVPEPGTMLLLGSAVAGLLVVGRKRMQR